jgi:hypothetical protein
LAWLTAVWLWATTDWSWLKALQLAGWILSVLDVIGFALVIIVLVPRLKPLFSKATWITKPVCWILQIPLGQTLNDFKNSLLRRSNAESALSYMERVIDRQINKARGILPFNSIIMTIRHGCNIESVVVGIILGALGQSEGIRNG